jgi:hypothetical protein
MCVLILLLHKLIYFNKGMQPARLGCQTGFYRSLYYIYQQVHYIGISIGHVNAILTEVFF